MNPETLVDRIKAHAATLPRAQNGAIRRALATRSLTCVQRGETVECTAWLDDGPWHFLTLEVEP